MATLRLGRWEKRQELRTLTGAVAKYDRIGTGYDSTRKPDARITASLVEHLALPPGSAVVDVGCGTGNYTVELARRGYQMTGVDPSTEMLAHARAKSGDVRWMSGSSDTLPLNANTFDGTVATLTIHHWADLSRAFLEVRRVVKSGERFVVFSATPEQTSAYWVGHYFPKALAAAVRQMPTQESVALALRGAGFSEPQFVPWQVPSDLTDLFWYAGKDHPELYFSSAFRMGVSAFREHCTPRDLESGLAKLRADLDTGRWQNIRTAAQTAIGDYCFFIAEAT